jgi:hypothetical protein
MSLDFLNRAILRDKSALDLPALLSEPEQTKFPPLGPPLDKLGVVQGSGFIGFTLNGTLAWLVDVRRFAGTPSLVTEASDPPRGLTIELKNALFPGTQLPADFKCVLQAHGFLGTPMQITFVLGGFQAQGIIERWLSGQQALQSPMTLNADVCPVGSAGKLSLTGPGEVRFFPNWLFQMAGQKLALIVGLGPDIASDRFSLKLLFPGEPSLSAHPKSRRTRLALDGAGQSWGLKPSVLTLPIGALTPTDGLFDRIDIEAGEGPANDVARVLVASSNRTDGLSLAVGGGITDLDGKPLSLPLTLPTYAIAFDPTTGGTQGDQTALIARFLSVPQWLSVSGFALLIGDTAGPPGFEADTLRGTVTSVLCAPALLAAAAPFASNTGETVATRLGPLPPGTTLPFVSAPGASPGWGVIALTQNPDLIRLSLPDFGVIVIRREDLLALDFRCYNLAIEAGGTATPRLVRKDKTQPAYLAVYFHSPQNIAEQAFLETSSDGKGGGTTGEIPLQPPVRAVAAGPSRLVFQLPDGTDTLQYSIDGLLDWVALQQSVAPVALDPSAPVPSPPPQIRQPLATETAIESPWHLFLSPSASETWAHSAAAVTLSNRTELWHTRLAARAKAQDGFVADETQPRTVRAVWSPDYLPGAPPPPPGHMPEPPPSPMFRMSLDANDRDQIVRLSSDFTMGGYQPLAVNADKLFLSSLGAWMDVLGDWNPPINPWSPQSFSVQQWRHKAAMARDNYVRVVYAGYLAPGGHRASLVKVTERKFQLSHSGNTTAYLRQRFFLIVREPEKDYGFLPANVQRGFPFRRLKVTTLVTPSLDPPQLDGGIYSFFPKVGGQFFLFHLVGVDVDGQTAEFTAPLYFVEQSGAGHYATAANNWNGSGQTQRDLGGQKVAYAPSSAPSAGDAALDTARMTITTTLLGDDPPFAPQMSGADVNVPSVQQLTGNPGAVSIQLYPDYVANDFKAGDVYVQTLSTLGVGFRGDQSGGVATPNLQVNGLSRRFGTVSGTLNTIANGNFNPQDAFADLNARLFGVVPLKDLIEGIFGDGTVPKLLTERTSTTLQTQLHWAPVVKNYSLGPLALTFDNVNTALMLDASIETPLITGGAPQTSVSGALNGFTLSLASVVGIKFTGFAFTALAGKKLDVNANIASDGLQFQGDLSFLNELRKYVPSDGFSDPPSLDVTADGVTAGYSLAIPAIGVGVFSIENVRLSAALTLPFVTPAPLRFRFAFSEREHPFLITVSLLGGGGFFGIAVGPDGVEMLEASIEVGANVSIDVVVASGNVHIMAGVYLKLDVVSRASQLTGYLRAGGSLDVLGLISASVEFYLGFSYYSQAGSCSIAGEATITIEVHVLFFSQSVQASLRREFSDPRISFADLIEATDWDDYCDAFAT